MKELPPINPLYNGPHKTEEVKITLDEGDVIFRWPSGLSPESFADLEYLVAGVMARIKRNSTPAKPSETP